MLSIESLAGQGADLVLVPGWGSDSGIFDPLLPLLSPYFRVHRVLWQTSGWPADDGQLRYQLLNCLRRQAPSQAIWVGWSLGANLALTLADSFPEKVSRLVTLAFNPCFVQRDDWSCAMPQTEFLHFQQNFLTEPAATLKRFQALQVMGSTDRRQVMAALQSSLTRLPTARLSQLLQLLADDLRPQLKRLSQPQLHCLGAQDALVPCTSLLAAYPHLNPQVELRCYAQSAHLPFLSEASRWCEDLRQWCQA